MADYCNNCGTKIREDASFCEGCGWRIIDEREEKKQIAAEVEKELTEKIEKRLRTEIGQSLRGEIGFEFRKDYEKRVKPWKIGVVILAEITCLLFIFFFGKTLGLF
jgi:uncharacterized membrane protein YvbJ